MNLLSEFSHHLSEVYLPGAVALWCSLVFGLAALWGYARAMGGQPGALEFGRRSYRFFTLALVLTSAVFALALIRRDFRIEYVFQYSGTDLPIHYQFAAFWAGQKGSFLIWLLWGALLGLLLIKTCGRRAEPTVMGLYTFTLFGLALILVRENPFIMLKEAAVDGKGLNPLLQNDWMVIHPPIMFVGYSLSAIPFAFAISALWRKDYKDWAVRAFPWALAGFLVLGTAILMGGYWAYVTLGWGGYWGWDPVENASLIPWLIGTALIHGLYLERSKGRFRRMNLVLACLGYLAVLYGTFLTRSGVLADFSVHSFVDLGISGLLVFLMLFFLGIAVYLLATRLGKVPTEPNEDPMVSRGTAMVLGSIVVLVSGLLVTFGTSAPLITRYFMDNPAQVGPDWYNRMHAPIALAIALLISAVPFLTWRGVEGRVLLRKLGTAFGAAAAAAAGAAFLGVTHPLHLAVVFLAVAALVSNLQKVVDKVRAGGFASAGGYLTHVGVGVMLIGFLSSSAYDHSTKVTLEQGEPTEVGEWTLTFNRLVPRQGREKEKMEVLVEREGEEPFNVYPKLFVNDRTRQLMANPDVRNFLLQDLYISPIEYNPGQPPGLGPQMALARGESFALGDDAQIRFVDFDLTAGGQSMEAMQASGVITVGAVVEYTRGEETRRVVPLYRFNQQGQVQRPPEALPGGGQVVLAGIDAGEGAARLAFFGVGEESAGSPPTLALDLTTKPLIRLVWYGLYVVLFGGLLASWNRIKQLRVVEALARRG